MRKKHLHISDHAMVRYCERVLGLDVKAVRIKLSETLGPVTEGRHKLPGQDVVAVIQKGVVVTFVPEWKPLPPKKPTLEQKRQRRQNLAILNDPDFKAAWPET